MSRGRESSLWQEMRGRFDGGGKAERGKGSTTHLLTVGTGRARGANGASQTLGGRRRSEGQ